MIKTRLTDKWRRMTHLAGLESSEGPEVEESFDETVKDLVGYGLLYLTKRRLG